MKKEFGRVKHCIWIGLLTKGKDKANSCFEISSVFWTAVHSLLFFSTCYSHLWMVRVIEGKIVLRRWSEGKPRLLRVSGRFELGRFRVTAWESTVCANFVNFTHPSPRLQWVAFSCPFHHIIWAHLPKFLLSPGLILWLKRSYAPGFVICSCCFRKLLSWTKFWYRSVLNGPYIKWTPFMKRTNSPSIF